MDINQRKKLLLLITESLGHPQIKRLAGALSFPLVQGKARNKAEAVRETHAAMVERWGDDEADTRLASAFLDQVDEWPEQKFTQTLDGSEGLLLALHRQGVRLPNRVLTALGLPIPPEKHHFAIDEHGDAQALRPEELPATSAPETPMKTLSPAIKKTLASAVAPHLDHQPIMGLFEALKVSNTGLKDLSSYEQIMVLLTGAHERGQPASTVVLTVLTAVMPRLMVGHRDEDEGLHRFRERNILLFAQLQEAGLSAGWFDQNPPRSPGGSTPEYRMFFAVVHFAEPDEVSRIYEHFGLSGRDRSTDPAWARIRRLENLLVAQADATATPRARIIRAFLGRGLQAGERKDIFREEYWVIIEAWAKANSAGAGLSAWVSGHETMRALSDKQEQAASIIAAFATSVPEDIGELGSATDQENDVETSNKVFIVHGHDKPLKDQVKAFLYDLGLQPVAIADEPRGGSKTIIEHFLNHSEGAACAIVLLSPDDVGGVADAGITKERARQNVIFELGFFMGRIDLNRVVMMKKGAVEIPSDLHGILYVPVDDGDGWKWLLSRELRAMGLPVKD